MVMLLNSCSENEEEVFYYRYIDFPDELIYEDGKHSAFTDLCKYRDHYYLCFRNATTHVPKCQEEYGSVLIYESKNGKTWSKILVVSDVDYDLRDPKLVVDASGHLMLYCGCSHVINGDLFFYGTKAGCINLGKKTCSFNLSFNKFQQESFTFLQIPVHSISQNLWQILRMKSISRPY